MRKKEQCNENFALLCEKIGGKNCGSAKWFRATNRRIEKRRRASHRRNIKG